MSSSTNYLVPKNFDEANTGKQLSAIRKESGENEVLKIVVSEIRILTKEFNLIRPMNADQIVSAARKVVEKYWDLKPGDFRLCFYRASLGEYPEVKILDAMDIRMIVGFLNEYSKQKYEYITGKQITKKSTDESKFNNVMNVIAPLLPELKKITEKFDAKDEEKEEAYRKYQAEYFKKQQENKNETK